MWEEDGLDLDLDENNEIKETEETWNCDCESDSLTGSWEKVVDDSKDFSDTTSRCTNMWVLRNISNLFARSEVEWIIGRR